MSAQRGPFYPLSIYYALIFMSVGSFTSFIGLYYAEVQLANYQIGVLGAAGAFISFIIQPWWGMKGDRAKLKNTIISFTLALSALTVWLMPLAGNNFWLLLLATLIFYFFQCAINPLSDTITLELADKHHFTFSRIRTVGSLGYAIMAAVSGWLIGFNVLFIFITFSSMLVVAFILFQTLPKVAGHQREGRQVRFMELLKNKRLVLIYLYAFILATTLGFYMTFHAIYSEEQGISSNIIGIGVMLGSLSQFPFMIYFDWFYRKFGLAKLLIFSGMTYILRWVLLSFPLTEVTVIVSWLLHGTAYIVFYLCLAEYVNRHVPMELKASGQMMNAIVLMSLSRVIGSVVGGLYTSWFSFQSAFIVSAVISLFGMLGFSYLILKGNRMGQPIQ